MALRSLETRLGDRLNSHIYSILRTQAGIIALGVLAGATKGCIPMGLGGFGMKTQPGVKVTYQLGGLMETVWLYKEVEIIQMGLFTDRNPNAPKITSEIGSVTLSSIVAEFFLFSSMAVEWMKEHSPLRTSYDQWPETINFARTIRNAIAHGGRITIDSPRALAGSWMGLKYSHHDKGNRVIPDDIVEGDLIVLMFDLNEELSNLAAPHIWP